MPIIPVAPPWYEKSLTERLPARAWRDARLAMRDPPYWLGLAPAAAVVTGLTFPFLDDPRHSVWIRAVVAGVAVIGGGVLELVAVFLAMAVLAHGRRRRERDHQRATGKWLEYPWGPKYWRY